MSARSSAANRTRWYRVRPSRWYRIRPSFLADRRLHAVGSRFRRCGNLSRSEIRSNPYSRRGVNEWAVSRESIRIWVVTSVLRRYTRYRNVYMADGPAWVHSARQYRHLLPSPASTSIVLGGRPSTTSTSMRWPASGPRWRTAVIVGAVSVSEVASYV